MAEKEIMMKNIQTAAILGAGAIGGYLVHELWDVLGDDLWLIADGGRKKRLEAEGILVNGRRLRPAVKTAAQSEGVDILFVSVKHAALSSVLGDIEAACGPQTIVMSLMNGVDSEDRIAERIGSEPVLDAMIKVASRRTDEGICFEPPISTLGIFFGERSGKTDTEKVLAVSHLFDRAKMPYHVRSDILRDIWLKYALNIAQNIPQAIVGCGMGAYFESRHMSRLREMLCDEVFELAATCGIKLQKGSAYVKAGEVTKNTRFSTLQDLDAGRPTEIDMLCGTVIRLAAEAGLETPYNTMAYHLIKALEEKNEGMFKYE